MTSWSGIKSELEKGENNENIRHIILFAQEPVIPNGGHIDDAMWWSGNNNITAYTANAGRLEREQKGIIDVRNEFVEAVTFWSEKKIKKIIKKEKISGLCDRLTTTKGRVAELFYKEIRGSSIIKDCNEIKVNSPFDF